MIKEKSIKRVIKNGLICSSCSINIPYSEMIMSKLLHALGIDFIHEKSMSWSNGRRYDFYLPSYNMIIETHGMQHYKNNSGGKRKRSLEEEQENDRYKEQLARENGIEYYLQIDCRHSDILYIENSIMESELVKIIPSINKAIAIVKEAIN